MIIQFLSKAADFTPAAMHSPHESNTRSPVGQLQQELDKLREHVQRVEEEKSDLEAELQQARQDTDTWKENAKALEARELSAE